MSTVDLTSCDHGVVATVKRCIMERDTYPRRWGMGPVALKKKQMKNDGKLDKFGRANENTPESWKKEYVSHETEEAKPVPEDKLKAPEVQESKGSLFSEKKESEEEVKEEKKEKKDKSEKKEKKDKSEKKEKKDKSEKKEKKEKKRKAEEDGADADSEKKEKKKSKKSKKD
jgi:H/ACA ribonucleoprotein complex subunit 4